MPHKGTALRSFFRSRGWTYISLSSSVHQEALQPLFSFPASAEKSPRPRAGGHLFSRTDTEDTWNSHSCLAWLKYSTASAHRDQIHIHHSSALRHVSDCYTVKYQLVEESKQWAIRFWWNRDTAEREKTLRHTSLSPQRSGALWDGWHEHTKSIIHESCWTAWQTCCSQQRQPTAELFPCENASPVGSEAGIVPCVERMNEYKHGCCKLEISSSASAAVDLWKSHC